MSSWFCRNLLIYFDDLSRREAAEAIFTALEPAAVSSASVIPNP